MDLANNIRVNVIIAVFNAICFIGLIVLTEFVGLHAKFISDKMLHWVNNCNPFIVFMCIALFNIARNVNFTNKCINYLSSLSMLIYVIHENIILRNYFRPAIWEYVYLKFGYNYLISKVLILSIIIFLFGIFASVLYSFTIRKYVMKISRRLYDNIRNTYINKENQIISKI